jgi:hypothetical protein
MDTISLYSRTSFFEKQVSEYAKVQSILQLTPNITCSLLRNSTKSCNKSHLPILLHCLPIYVVIQTCTWGHRPHTWFSLTWQF